MRPVKKLLGRRPPTADGGNGRKFDTISPPDRLRSNRKKRKKTPSSNALGETSVPTVLGDSKPAVAAQPVSAIRQEKLGTSIHPSRKKARAHKYANKM